jgi:hypothetical protein
MLAILMDAGPLTALLNPNDQWHAWARDTMRRLAAPLLTTEPVLTEACRITLKLRVPSPPAQHTLVQGAKPVRTGVRCVQHFPFLGLLPPPKDGWSDVTALFRSRHGLPKFGQAIRIRTCSTLKAGAISPEALWHARRHRL